MVFLAWFLALPAEANPLVLHDQIQAHVELRDATVQMTGRSELHLTGRVSDPMTGTQVHLNSSDAWLFFRHVRPSVVNSTFLGRVRVSGAPAVINQNVRVVQHGVGAVVIPHAPTQVALEVFSERNFEGATLTFRANEMGEGLPGGRTPWNNAIRSFRLRRGYMVTFAVNADGGGPSRVYIAQDGDLEVGALPAAFDRNIEFVRVLPWRWVSKKGYAGGVEDAGGEPDIVRSAWFYNWNNNRNSSLNIEYVPIQQTAQWPSLTATRNMANVTHLLGFNEPDTPHQDAHRYTPTPQSAADHWPRLMRAGFRLGSPAPTDGGLNWLYGFMDIADAADLRVDYVVVHFYRCGQTATQLYDFLRAVHLRTGRRPIWLKEFNNGANWTACADPTLEQNANVIRDWINMLDATPWVERYSIYSWVEESRQVFIGGQLTPMGVVYRDQESPIGHRQQMPAGAIGNSAHYRFDGNVRDGSGFANHAMRIGAPRFTAESVGNAIVFDGRNDWLQLSPNVGAGSDFTFAAWVRWDGGGNWQRIFDFGDGDTTPGRQLGRFIFLTPRSGAGTMRLALRIDGTEQQLDAPPLTPGQWAHVAVTIGRANVARMYVNGALVASSTAFSNRPAGVTARFSYLGRSQFPADPLFGGMMADVRILDQELSPAQISELAAPPPPSFQQWAAALQLPAGQNGPNNDPDGDGIPNVFEYLLGANPFAPSSSALPIAVARSGSELGPEADPARNYLSLAVRARKSRPGVILTAEAANTLEGLSSPGAAANVRQVMPPVDDGEFEIITFYFTEPMENAPNGRGFMRLNVTVQ